MKLAQYENQPVLIETSLAGVTYHVIENADSVQALLPNLNQQDWQLGQMQTLKDFSGLQAPISQPRQIFGVGFNYSDHLKELAAPAPKEPNFFTKFVSSLTGPEPTVQVQGSQTDWETELVVVVGKGGRHISVDEAATHIAGYMVGEDLSDRRLQFANPNPQFSLAKSHENFSPTGPWLTTPDELEQLGELTITTTLNDVEKQHSQLKQLIFDANALVSYLSQVVALYPGDLIFTGTPGGVGTGRNPQEFIHAGDVVVGAIEDLGALKLTFVD